MVRCWWNRFVMRTEMLTERCRHTEGTLNYQNRVHKFAIILTPKPNATLAKPSGPSLQFTYETQFSSLGPMVPQQLVLTPTFLARSRIPVSQFCPLLHPQEMVLTVPVPAGRASPSTTNASRPLPMADSGCRMSMGRVSTTTQHRGV